MKIRALFVMLVVLPVWAGEPVRLTLKEAVEAALRQNPALAKARQALEDGDARIKLARAEYYPQLSFSGIAKLGLSGATNGLGLFGLPNSPLYRNLADSVNASQTLFDFGRTAHRVQRERRHREALDSQLAAVEAEVAWQTERAYYNLLRAQKMRDAASEAVRAREVTVRQAQAFYEGKIRSRIDLDLARVGLSRAQLQLIQAESGVRAGMAELGRDMGSSQDSEYSLEVPDLALVPPDPVDHLIPEATEFRPELRAIRAEREAARENLELVRSQRKPLFSMVFSGGYARFTESFAKRLLAGGAGLAFPLFTGGRLEALEKEAEGELRILESREEELKQQVELEVRLAYLKLQASLESMGALRQQAEHARQASRLASERYREQLGNIVELNETQSNLAQSLADEAAGAYDAKIAESGLRFAVGRR